MKKLNTIQDEICEFVGVVPSWQKILLKYAPTGNITDPTVTEHLYEYKLPKDELSHTDLSLTEFPVGRSVPARFIKSHLLELKVNVNKIKFRNIWES